MNNNVAPLTSPSAGSSKYLVATVVTELFTGLMTYDRNLSLGSFALLQFRDSAGQDYELQISRSQVFWTSGDLAMDLACKYLCRVVNGVAKKAKRADQERFSASIDQALLTLPLKFRKA